MAYKIQLVRGETVEIEVEAATASMAWNAAVSFCTGNPHHVVRCETDQGWREVRSVTYYQEVAAGSNSEMARNPADFTIPCNVPSTEEMALRELEAVAPHLFQLRKFGFFSKVPDELQQLVLAVDARRAQRVFDFINGTVMSEQDRNLIFSDEIRKALRMDPDEIILTGNTRQSGPKG